MLNGNWTIQLFQGIDNKLLGFGEIFNLLSVSPQGRCQLYIIVLRLIRWNSFETFIGISPQAFAFTRFSNILRLRTQEIISEIFISLLVPPAAAFWSLGVPRRLPRVKASEEAGGAQMTECSARVTPTSCLAWVVGSVCLSASLNPLSDRAVIT